MFWLLLILALVVLVAVGAIGALASMLEETMTLNESARIEAEVRFAEHRLHDLARNGLAAMLEEARRDGHGRVS